MEFILGALTGVIIIVIGEVVRHRLATSRWKSESDERDAARKHQTELEQLRLKSEFRRELAREFLPKLEEVVLPVVIEDTLAKADPQIPKESLASSMKDLKKHFEEARSNAMLLIPELSVFTEKEIRDRLRNGLLIFMLSSSAARDGILNHYGFEHMSDLVDDMFRAIEEYVSVS